MVILAPRVGRVVVGRMTDSGYDDYEYVGAYDRTGEMPVDVDTILRDAPFAKQAGPSAAGSPSPATRLANAHTIVRVALDEGLPLGVALAMVVNADAESALNHAAIGDGGHAIGLFQANDLGGKRTFPGDRRDPAATTRWIISEYRAAVDRTTGKDKAAGDVIVSRPSLASALASGRSVADIAGLFAFYVERPAALQKEEAARRGRTSQTFPTVASAPANSLVPGGPGGASTVSTVITKIEKAAPATSTGTAVLGGATMLAVGVFGVGLALAAWRLSR